LDDDLVVNHRPEGDDVVPQVCLAFGAVDPETVQEPGVTRSSWWRLAPGRTWLDVARRYRACLEKKSGVRTLWQHNPVWVRDIHAVCTTLPPSPEQAEAFYADLAARFDPKKLLLAHLYMDEELFNDLPESWDPEALAYYRGKGGRWFQFRRLPYGDGYRTFGLKAPEPLARGLRSRVACPEGTKPFGKFSEDFGPKPLTNSPQCGTLREACTSE
jgi:hypothetical protein